MAMIEHDLESATDSAGLESGRITRLMRPIGLALVGSLVAVGCTPTATRDSDSPQTGSHSFHNALHREVGYQYSVLSSPDFLNFDIGDVRTLPTWQPGDPNSYNRGTQRALQTVFRAFLNEHVPDVLVAGDLVEGHWGLDTAHTGLFGPTDTLAERRSAVKNAAQFYYKKWLGRFASRGLKPFPAVGDHELGDDPWSGGQKYAWYNRFKQRNVQLFKQEFSDELLTKQDGSPRFPNHPEGPAASTAYAVKLSPEVELITLDIFKKTTDNVVEQVDGRQLEWAKQQMAKAREQGVDWLVVQYHTPAIGHVRIKDSSDLMYHGGTHSKLWQALKQYHVNLVLNGEVHDVTARQLRPGQPVQITHGGAFQHGLTNYMRLDFSHNQVDITAVGFDASKHRPKHPLWQTDGRKMPKHVYEYSNPHEIGSMVLSRSGKILERSGLLDMYDGRP